MSGTGMPEGTELGKIGDKVVFENDRVRVWSLTVPPGGIQPWHRHDLPYLVVPLTNGDNLMRFADGRERTTKEAPGDAIWREPGIPHELENRGGAIYSNVLIEFK
jgi:beta-alanine degradation protein BauB